MKDQYVSVVECEFGRDDFAVEASLFCHQKCFTETFVQSARNVLLQYQKYTWLSHFQGCREHVIDCQMLRRRRVFKYP
jgi:hypothetical protein